MALEKLNRLIEIHEQARPLKNAHEFVEYLKPRLREKFKPCFLKTLFDRTAKGSGAVFIKFARLPWRGACNEALENSDLNFMICIDGFDGEGNFDEDSVYTVEMYKYRDDKKHVKKMANKKFCAFEDVRTYVERYFKCVQESLGTASGATGYADGGIERTQGDIAVKPYHAGIYRRFRKKKVN